MIAGIGALICLVVSCVMLGYLLYDMDKRIKYLEKTIEDQLKFNEKLIEILEEEDQNED